MGWGAGVVVGSFFNILRLQLYVSPILATQSFVLIKVNTNYNWTMHLGWYEYSKVLVKITSRSGNSNFTFR